MLTPTKNTVTKRQQYTAAWQIVKDQGKLELVVHKDHAPAVEWGILRAKTRENTANRRMGLRTWNKLVINRTPVSELLVKMEFALSHDDRLL